MIKRLEKEFVKKDYEGFNEVKFNFVSETEHYYLYKRTIGSYTDYEVFEKRSRPALIVDNGKFINDYDNMKEYYPKANDFGKWAWNFGGINKESLSYEKLYSKEKKYKERKNK